MRFINPPMLWLCAILIPLLIAFLFWSVRRREKLARQFIKHRFLVGLAVGIAPIRDRIRLLLITLSVLALLIALARPQWGFEEEEYQQRGIDILLAIDTSKSMLARDVLPNRLERSKLAAFDLMSASQGDRLGLIAFSGSAFLQCPLTFDHDIFRQTVDALDVGIIPQGGTSLKACIDAAIEAYQSNDANPFKILIVFTDGEDHEEGVLESADRAATAGLRVYTVGVGTPAGELLSQKDANGNDTFVKDSEGNVVKSRLNESLLIQIASITQGAFVNLTDHLAMEKLYEQSIAPLPKTEISTMKSRTYFERFQWPLAFAILALMLEILIPDPRPERLNRPAASQRTTPRAAVLWFLCALLFLSPPTLHASAGKAGRLFEKGEYQASLEAYEALLQKSPEDSRLLYNAGTSAYHAGDLEKASQYLSQVVIAPDINLQQQAYYNLGHVQYARGAETQDLNQKIKEWTEAVKLFEGAHKINPEDQDASFNRDALKKLLEQIQPPPEEDSSESDQDSEEDPEDKDQDSSEQQQKEEGDQEQEQQGEQKEQEEQQSGDENQQEQGNEKDSQEEEPSPNQEEEPGEEENQPSPSKPDQEEQNNKEEESKQGETGETAPMSEMTKEEAMKLLDALKDKEKSLPFQPPKKSGRRTFKDW